MSEISSISSIAPSQTPANVELTNPVSTKVDNVSFSDVMSATISKMENKVDTANEMVKSFALDDNVPVHQVTMALADAQLHLELVMQVRSQLVETYREIMNMQI